MTKEIKFFIETLEKLTGKKVILEANVRWAPIVLDYVTKHPGQTNKEILSGLGIPISDIQKNKPGGFSFSTAQSSVLINLRKLVTKGILSREKKGREFVYSLASSSANPISKPEVKTNKSKKGLTFEQVFELINQKWPYRNREGNKFEGRKGDYYLDFNTDDRGPRTDHGGEDGDGWMGSEEIRRVSKPYIDKWRPRLDQLEKELKQAGVDVKTYVDYGEKGHVALQLQIKTPLKESSLKEDDSRYDHMKHYPESHLHPLVQQSLKYQYERLKGLFPGLDNFDVKQDDDKVIRMHYTYKGKPYKTRVDLNGDTGTRAFNAIKRNIAPKPKSGRLINTLNYRF